LRLAALIRRVIFVSVLSSCWTNPAAAIVGDATPGNPFDDAYHVVLSVGSDNTACTGVVLSRSLVLTTAWCVKPGFQYQIVQIDSLRLSIPVRDIEIHPDFDVRRPREHRATTDLAILRLAAPLPLFIYTPSLGAAPQVGETLTIVGYGVGDVNVKDGRVRAATLEVTGNPGRFQIQLFDPMRRGASPGLGACSGDMGGPAFQKRNAEVTLVGVIEWSTGPNEQRGCGGLTGLVPISPNKDWITTIVSKFGGSSVARRPESSGPNVQSKIPAANRNQNVAVVLKRDGGIFVVPVEINGAITLDFGVDSGAADVSVPADVFSTLTRTGTIKTSDIIGEQKYVLADGSTSPSVTFTIRSLKVGDNVIQNVRASVAPARGALLLGQSFLERFKSWSIDNTRHELRLELQ
jgi:clan AA aspartic protease (TIGR02281 family)